MSLDSHTCPNQKCGYLLPQNTTSQAVAIARCPVCDTSVRVGARGRSGLAEDDTPTELLESSPARRRAVGGSLTW